VRRARSINASHDPDLFQSNSSVVDYVGCIGNI
jgi:hypothetical protein